jgi:hypothetical protein
VRDRGTARRRVARARSVLTLGVLVLPVLSLEAPAGAATSSSLSQYLLKSNEMPGYTVGGHPSTMTTAAGLLEGGSLTKKQRSADIGTLQKAGFVKAVEESAKGTNANEGVTVNGSAGGSANAYWFAGNCAFGSGIYDGTATSAKAVAAPVQTGIKSQAKRVGATCP